MTSNAAIRERLKRGVVEHVFPGAVTGVVTRAGKRDFITAGRFTYDESSPMIVEDTVYDVASITKAVPVGLLALRYIEEGKLGLDEQVVKYIPEVSMPGREKGLIRHLLTYTYVLAKNLDPNFSYEHQRAEDIFDFLYHRSFAFSPGSRYQYSNTPANLLGVILERISGKKLYALAQERVLDPLGMSHSGFHPSKPEEIPPTEIVSWRGEVQGIVHDETAFILERAGYDPGCAGLFSNANDVLNVAEMILNGGSFGGVQIFTERTVSLMVTNALSMAEQSCGIGWELNQPRFMGRHAHEHMIGKTGFTGTCMVIDPKSGRAFVHLSNRTYPKRGSADPINAVRRDIADAVFAS